MGYFESGKEKYWTLPNPPNLFQPILTPFPPSTLKNHGPLGGLAFFLGGGCCDLVGAPSHKL
jgi:hypothetical protein